MAEQTKTREESGTKISDDIMNRAKAIIGIVMGKVPAEQWMGAGHALPPVAQDTEGRKTDYSVFRNQQTQPKVDEGISFTALRNVADLYDPLRIIIETRKDQVAGQTWTIKPKGKNKKENAKSLELVALFQCPDGENDWASWLRIIMEDLLVLDAVAIYPRKTVGGKMYGFECIDAATIKRCIDDSGRTPIAPATAYQQVIKGMPASDYAADELIYRMRNPRSNRFYGYSPVEQVVNTVQTGLHRQVSQLNYFTDGTIPDAFAGVPEGWTIAQIKEWQNYFDKLMQGDPSKKRSVRFLAAEMAKTYKETKQPPLKDSFDEWIMRIICYSFSIDPTPFIAQVNRSVAETTREQALQEGLVPILNWIKNLVNYLLAKYCDSPDMEFVWEEEEAIKPVDQATVHKTYVDAGVLTVDEVREEIGRDPMEVDGEEGTAGTAGGKDIQQTALNGTQISSMMAIVAEVASKNLPPEAGIAIMRAAFPTTPQELVDNIFNSLKNFEKPEPILAAGAVGPDGKPLPNAGAKPAVAGEDGEPVLSDDSEGAAAPAKKPVTPVKVEKGETHIHIHNQIAQPDVFVDVGATTIHATVGDLTKSETIERNDT